MGVFQVELEIGDPQGERYETVSALVDSGATYTILPSSLLQELGVASELSRSFILADGRHIERDFGETRIRINGENHTSPVVFGADNSMPLLGAVTLEIFALGIDPVNGRLIHIDSLM